ncbi:MAG: oligosaccharide flippase family protein [Pseudomonadales bacterium]|nr:oligosaccharide flippase family protein [Pseudomonadales bacterium]
MSEKTLFNYLKKSFFTGAFKTVVVTFSTLIFLPLIIQKVGMETYGLISLTMIFGGVVVFADFGIAKTVTLLIGRDEDKSSAGMIVSNALVINILMMGIIGAVLAVIAFLDAPILGEKLQVSRDLKNYIILVGFVLLVIMLLNNLLAAILEAKLLMHYVNIGFTISSVAINAFIYAACMMSDSIYILLAAPIASFLVVSFYLLNVIRVYTEVRLVRPDVKQIRGMLSTSYRFLNLGLVNSLIIPANKYVLMLVTGSSTALGVFDVALKIALIANSFLNSIAQPLFGVFSNMAGKKNEIYKIACRVSLLLFVLYIVGCLVYYFVGHYIVRFIDAENVQELYRVSLILLFGVGFLSVSEPFYRALLGAEKLKAALYLKLLVPVVNISFFSVLVNTVDLDRISLAYAAGLLVSSLAIIVYVMVCQAADQK